MGQDITLSAETGFWRSFSEMADEAELVRCVECRHEYEQPRSGGELGCPDCGGLSWVAARIPPDPVESAEPPAT
jgi:protein-arginine kinase activator protein McsA